MPATQHCHRSPKHQGQARADDVAPMVALVPALRSRWRLAEAAAAPGEMPTASPNQQQEPRWLPGQEGLRGWRDRTQGG